MEKTFEIVIVVTTSEEVGKGDFHIQNHGMIDGFELSRNARLGDITGKFYLKQASIKSIKEVKR